MSQEDLNIILNATNKDEVIEVVKSTLNNTIACHPKTDSVRGRKGGDAANLMLRKNMSRTKKAGPEWR